MATLIGVVSQVVGEVYAVAGDGARRPLVEGDRVYAGEQIVTGAAGAIAVAMTNGQQLTLGRDSSLTLTEQMLAYRPDSQAPAVDSSPAAPSDSDLTDVEQLQAAIEAGVDPTLAGEATAAGPGAGGAAGGAGGGHSFVLLGEVGGQLDPVIGFPTAGLQSGPEFPNPDPDVLLDTPEPPPPEVPDFSPVIEVIYLDGPPGGDGGGNQPGVVAGPGVVDEAALASGSNPGSTAESTYGSLVINSPDGVSRIEIQGADGVWVNVLGGGTVVGVYGTLQFDAAGNWVYTLNANTLDHSNAGATGAADQVGESFPVRVFDGDGDVSPTVSLDVVVYDDGPSIELAATQLNALVVDETDLSADATVNFSGAFSSAFGADGAGNISYALNTTGAPSGLVDVATGLDIVLGMNGSVVEGWVGGDSSVVAFTVSVDGSGNVTLDQLRALQHPDGSNPDDPVSVAGGAITLVATVTDGDGDQASASLNLGGFLTFRDDGPSIDVVSQFDVSLEVDETNLALNDSVDVAGAFSGSYGADGSGTTSYAVSTVNGTDSGLVDVASNQSIFLYNTASGVEGRVGGEGGAVAFSVTVVGSLVTLDQVLAIKHPTNDPNEPISPNAGSLSLTATITDKDGDSDNASLDLSGSLTFRDDGPHFLSVMDAVISSSSTVAFNGLYNASFGADGLDFLSVALAETGIYAGESVSFVQSNTAEAGVFKVDVTDGANEVLFSFYYTTVTNAVSGGGDGSVEFYAFSSLADPAGSPFFELTINPDGTYTFEMISNEVISSTTVSGSDFGAFGPVGEVATADQSLIIRGSESVNASNNGIGVGTTKINNGQWLEMDFAKPQGLVSFTTQQWTGGPNAIAVLAVIIDGLALDFNQVQAGTQNLSVVSGTERITVLVDTDLAGTWVYSAASKTYTIYVDSEFTNLRIDHADGSAGFNINEITYDQTITIEELSLNFNLAITDGDGDMSALDDELTISMLDPDAVISAVADGVDAENGVVLVGNGGHDILIGGEGDDILIGELGNDTMTGGGGADTFVFAEAGLAHADVITDYNFEEGDRIDLGALLDANFGVASNVNDFVHITAVGPDAKLEVDVDGLNGDFVEVATLNNIGVGDKVMLLIGGQEQEYTV